MDDDIYTYIIHPKFVVFFLDYQKAMLVFLLLHLLLQRRLLSSQHVSSEPLVILYKLLYLVSRGHEQFVGFTG